MQTEKTFNNRYRVDGQLGNGGMAIVYRGTDTLLRRRVAIKVLRDQYATDDDFVKRFSYEAQAAAKLSHPNIVNVYDFGREDSAYYIVMELVDGTTLGDLLRDDRELPEPVAVDYAIQTASGLAYAHRQGLLHRDVKPANILVTGDDVVKLSDFGIARAVSEHTLGVTQPGMVMGSVAYISPEQAQGKELDERSDLYSVGVVLYQMLTGRLPFTGETPVAVALKHVSEQPPALDAAALGISPAIASIVMRLLRKDPTERFGSATELARALRESRERPDETQNAAFADAPTSRFGTVGAPQPPPRPSAAPDRGAEPAYVEVAASRHLDGRWIAIPLLFLAAIALGFFALHGGLFAPPKDIAVPALLGTSETVAQQRLLNLGLRATVTSEKSETVAAGRVLRQSPDPGTKLARDETVALAVSGGLPQVTIPDIRGYSLSDAAKRLAEAKLEIKPSGVFSASVPAGQVIDVSPPVNTSLAERGVVSVTVSKGAQPVNVPNILGKSQDAAAAALRARGLAIDPNVQQAQSDDVAAGTIMSQDPQPEAAVSPGATVSVTVSTGAAQVPVPAVVGSDPDAARASLQNGGFTVRTQYAVDQNATEKVSAQDPPGGASARRRSVVTVTISVPGVVPDVTGMGPDDARRALTAAGYAVGNTSCVQDSTAKDGAVVRTEPAANTPTKPGESIVLYLNLSGTTCP